MKNIQKRILDLSKDIGVFSFPMKPFIRFSDQPRAYADDVQEEYPQLFWDFDYHLQRILAELLHEVASPMEITELCVEYWKDNLENLYLRRKKDLEWVKKEGIELPFISKPREEKFSQKIPRGGSLLYVGCGAGAECIRYAQRGFNVTGIDTDPLLVDIANEWAEYFRLPFKAICMDLMNLDLEERSFDAFLLEFYGSWPLLSQVITVQRNLEKVLKAGGKGLVVAQRKKYASFCFELNAPYTPPMTRWLLRQTAADLFYSDVDGCEERLSYGIYNKSHTEESLSSELNNTFDVLECAYEKDDQRYVTAVVGSKPEIPDLTLEQSNQMEENRKRSESIVENTVSKIESLNEKLTSHTRDVVGFFGEIEKSDKNSKTENPLKVIRPDLSGVSDLLIDIFKGYRSDI
ncbi:class I SAM-dependent methyltransferase [Candidatus Omnitrophota bacterium]